MTCAAIQASKSRRLTRAERLKITVWLLEEEPYSESRSHTFCLPTWCSNLRAQPSPGPEGAAATAANVRRRRLPSIFPPRGTRESKLSLHTASLKRKPVQFKFLGKGPEQSRTKATELHSPYSINAPLLTRIYPERSCAVAAAVPTAYCRGGR